MVQRACAAEPMVSMMPAEHGSARVGKLSELPRNSSPTDGARKPFDQLPRTSKSENGFQRKPAFGFVVLPKFE
ncbi:hypothetical protein D3C83_52250 [compost metagenome]